MPDPLSIGRCEKISISLQRRWMLIPLALRLLCMAIALQAFGMQQLIAADAAFNEPARSVVLIDSALAPSIPKEELAGSRVIPIDGNGDVVAQITKALGTLTKIDVLRVISHGSDGKLWFGKQSFDATTLHAHSPQVAAWKKSLSADAQILLYGCSVAGTNQGKLLINRLASLTHANVAASTNPTGTGGDTVLEYGVGEIRSGLLANLADYERAGVSLQVETSDSTLTSWTSNQNGTVTATISGGIENTPLTISYATLAAIFCAVLILPVARGRAQDLYVGSNAAHSVVLIDSQLAGSIPKGELAGSQIKSYFFKKTKIAH